MPTAAMEQLIREGKIIYVGSSNFAGWDVALPRARPRLRAELGALSVDLDDEPMRRLDQIWPGPGEAPQAYAW